MVWTVDCASVVNCDVFSSVDMTDSVVTGVVLNCVVDNASVVGISVATVVLLNDLVVSLALVASVDGTVLCD